MKQKLRKVASRIGKEVTNINVVYFVSLMLMAHTAFAQGLPGVTGAGGGLCQAKTWIYVVTNIGCGASIVWKGLGALSAHRHGADVMHEIYGMLPGAAVALIGDSFMGWFTAAHC
jgi:hypothetical protein